MSLKIFLTSDIHIGMKFAGYTPEDLMRATRRHPLVQIFAALDMEETHWEN